MQRKCGDCKERLWRSVKGNAGAEKAYKIKGKMKIVGGVVKEKNRGEVGRM